MEQDLGNVIQVVRCPEQATKSKPMGTLILSGLLFIMLPMLVVAFFASSLLKRARMNPLIAWIVCIAAGILLICFLLWTTKKWLARYAEQVLEIREQGVSGVFPANAFKSKSFAIPYTALKGVTVKKNRLILQSDKGSCNLFVDNAEDVANTLRQRCG